MKKRFIGKIEAVVIIAIMALGAAIIFPVESMPPDPGPAPEDIIRLQFSFSQPVITPILENETVYHQIRMDGTQIADDYNVPTMPIKPVSVLLPQRGEVVSIDVVCEGNTSLGYNYNVELGELPTSYNSSTAPPPPASCPILYPAACCLWAAV